MEEARFKAEAFCSASEHCRADVLSKLYQWGAPEESWEEILSYLEKEKYIDDYRSFPDVVTYFYCVIRWRRILSILMHEKPLYGRHGL